MSATREALLNELTRIDEAIDVEQDDIERLRLQSLSVKLRQQLVRMVESASDTSKILKG